MHLITPSLLNSFNHYLGVDEEYETEERKKILSVFRREKSDPTTQMEFGSQFENDVRGISGTVSTDGEYLHCVNQVRDIVGAGTWQLPCSKKYKNYLLYGRMDVVNGAAIYDIKTTSFYEVGKYRDSAQHRLYLACTGLSKCVYVVLEIYLGEMGVSVKSLSEEEYTQRDIEPMVDNFISALDNDPELKTLYFDKWKTKHND
jgi:hypothetical protein